VVRFDQTLQDNARQIAHLAQLKNDKHKEYARYAAHCLDLMPATKDNDARSILL
jgi:hypothetical protein